MIVKRLVIIGVMLFAVQVNAEEQPALKTQMDMTNYGIGVEFGRNLKRQGFEVNADVLIKGVKDGLAGRDFLLSERELRKTIVEFQIWQRAKRSTARNPAPEENNK